MHSAGVVSLDGWEVFEHFLRVHVRECTYLDWLSSRRASSCIPRLWRENFVANFSFSSISLSRL